MTEAEVKQLIRDELKAHTAKTVEMYEGGKTKTRYYVDVSDLMADEGKKED